MNRRPVAKSFARLVTISFSAWSKHGVPNCRRVMIRGPRPGSELRKYFRFLLAFSGLSLLSAAAANPSSGTTPFILDANRMYAELTFVRPDGTLHKTLAFVDLGSPSTILAEALFRELQLDQNKPLTFYVGEMAVQVEASKVTSDSWLPFSVGDNRRVEALLPAGVMQRFGVAIDYAHRTLTLAGPGILKPAGISLPCRVNEKTGLVVVHVAVNGQLYPVTLDTGSAYTWLRKATVQEWLAVHPRWQRGIGAVGASNMRMADDGIEATGILVRIGEIRLGSLHLRKVGALAIGPSNSSWDFIDWYSQKNPVPVIGWLGGNVLQGFRITIDYPHRMTYWLPQTELDGNDLDQVGLTLRSSGGEYFVAAVVTQNAKPTVEGIQPGDKLLQIDGLRTDAAVRSAVLSALHGKPGESRILLLERDSSRFTVETKVVSF